VGCLFGFFAQRSRFCLRAAVIEFWHRQFGEKLSVWLLTFATAVIAIQSLIVVGALDVSSARQLATRGSFSGPMTISATAPISAILDIPRSITANDQCASGLVLGFIVDGGLGSFMSGIDLSSRLVLRR